MLTAIILTKNSEKTLKDALMSVSFAQEIIVIDDVSSDTTKEIALQNKAVFYSRFSNGDFSAQRNWAMEKAQYEWILFVDSDENVTAKLQVEIQSFLRKETEPVAAYIKRHDYFWGKKLRYGEVLSARNKGLIRLMKKGSGKWIGSVHETYQVKQNLKTISFIHELSHYPHQSLKEYLFDVNFYSTLRAQELLRRKTKPSVFKLIVFPLSKFILTYFFYGGFLDGPAGFTYSFLMSFHSFLVQAKLFQYQLEKNS